MKKKIENLDLVYAGNSVSFLIRSMEEIASEQEGIVEDPHRHNFYSVIWSQDARGKHIIDFHEYPIDHRRDVKMGIFDDRLAGHQRITCVRKRRIWLHIRPSCHWIGP